MGQARGMCGYGCAYGGHVWVRVAGRRPHLCGVVGSEDREVLALSNRHLLDVRHEVVGDALGALADGARLVRANRVEVAQEDDVPFLVGVVQVTEDLLDKELGATVPTKHAAPMSTRGADEGRIGVGDVGGVRGRVVWRWYGRTG